MPSLAGFRQRQVRATPAAITDPSILAGVGTAAAQLGGAIAGAGVALGSIQDQRNTELAKADFEAMKADTAAARNEFLRSLRTTDLEYNEINKAWGNFKKKEFKFIGNTTKQRKAQQAYGSYIRRIIPQWDQDVDNIAWGVSSKRAKTKVFNSAVDILRNAPDFNTALLDAGMAIENSTLLTSEEKDLTLANSVIDTNPQWYLDNVDAEGTKKLFELLSPDQKRTLETKARESINRIRTEQTAAATELNTETRKTASDLWRDNKLSSDWLQTNRANMAASDYERYNNLLIKKARAEKTFQNNLAKIEDPFNREIFGKLDAANTEDELDALQSTVNDYVSPELKRLSVDEGKKWNTQIDAKRKELITSKADAFPAWSLLMDRITQVQAGDADIEAVRREIDRAIIPPEGQDATITPELAMSLRTRLEGIERNPEVKKRPSLTRHHASLGRLRSLQVRLLTAKDPLIPQLLRGQKGIDLETLSIDEGVIAIENSFIRIGTELDEYADLIAGDKDFDAKLNKKFQDLTRPIVEEVVLGGFSRFFRKRTGVQFFGLISSEETALASLRIESLEAQRQFQQFTPSRQQQAIAAIEGGSTVEEAIAGGEAPTNQRIQVRDPDTGEIFNLPQNQLDKAIKQGFERVE